MQARAPLRILGALAAAGLLLANGAVKAPATPVGPNGLVDVVGPEDYPPDALREGRQGRVRIRLDVDAQGRVSRCTVIKSAGAQSLDAAACRLMQARARFEPARDRKGRAVPDQVKTSVTWRLAASTFDPREEQAQSAYFTCLHGTVRALAAGNETEDAIADAAFAACTDPEQAFLQALSVTGPAPRADVRSSVRPHIVEFVQRTRAERAN
jgi:TonB family protein